MPEQTARDSPAIAIAVLAAGASTRLGRPKQLLRHEGEPLLRRVVRTAVMAHHSTVVVVLGARAALLRRELDGLPVRLLVNKQWKEGLASSVRCAVGAVGDFADAILFLTCDQPMVSTALLDQMMKSFLGLQASIVACEYSGTLGVPALFARKHFPELREMRGPQGAKAVIERHSSAAVRIPFPEGSRDVDTLEDLRRLLS
jgi:molybdenum cofactor cytidylyltransferase